MSNVMTKEVQFGEKTVIVKESKLKELFELGEKVFSDINKDTIKNATGFNELFVVIKELLTKKIPMVFSDITSEDVLDAYPSQINELVGAFIEVNFSSVKENLGTFLALMPK